MSTIEHACPACESAASLMFRTVDRNRSLPGSFTYFHCSGCRLVFIDPVPEDMRYYYAGGYQPRPQSLRRLRAMARRQAYRLESILPYHSSGRLLEIGPWIGLFSSNAKDRGFEVTAIEVDKECVDLLQAMLGIRAIQSADPAATLAQMCETFDVIALWHSIEHMPRPWDLITRAAKLLAPQGILLVSAPNPDSAQLAVLKDKWYHLDSPRHLYLLPQNLVRGIARREGLEVVSATTNDQLGKEVDRMGWDEWVGSHVPIPGVRHLAKRTVTPLLKRLHGSHKEGAGAGYTIIMRRP